MKDVIVMVRRGRNGEAAIDRSDWERQEQTRKETGKVIQNRPELRLETIL